MEMTKGWKMKYKAGDATRTQMLKEVGLTWEKYQKGIVSAEEILRDLGAKQPWDDLFENGNVDYGIGQTSFKKTSYLLTEIGDKQ